MTTTAGDLPDFVRANVATAATLFNGNPGALAFFDTPVAQYASVTVALQPAAAGAVTVYQYEFVDPASGLIIDSGTLSADTDTVSPFAFGPSWTLPVVAGTLRLLNVAGFNLNVLVVGQPTLSTWRMNHNNDPARLFQRTLVAGTGSGNQQSLAGLSTAGGVPLFPDTSSFDGMVTLALRATSAQNGIVRASYLDAAGTRCTLDFMSNATAVPQLLNVGHPRAYCTWYYLTTAAVPVNVTINLDITPAC